MQLPSWLDTELWNTYVQYRKEETKRPITVLGQLMAIKRLEKLHEDGYDCDEILMNVMEKGWQGIYIGDCKPISEKERKDKWNKKLGESGVRLGIVK
jgi:hypothetical protein